MTLDPQAIEALRILGQVLAENGRRFVLIGATVPWLLLDLRQGRESGSRATYDMDAAIEAETWEDFNRLRGRLSEAGFQLGSAPHQLRFGEDVSIDLIPFGPGLVQGDRLVWPETDTVMSALGLEEAFECAIAEELAPGFLVPIVQIPGLVLLKIIAYKDRPEERARDLTDLVYCFKHYEEEFETSRRFNLAGFVVTGRELQFDEAGAYLLGNEVAKLAKPKSLIVVKKFLEGIPDEYARPIGQALAEEGLILNNERRRTELFRLFRVFAAGLHNEGIPRGV